MEEATISRVHAAYRDGSLCTTALVRYYLDRIAAIDRQGPSLQSLLTLNARALDEAQRLDAAWRSGPVGPLHGVPVILKDNFDTQDLPTTGGSVAMRDSRPRRDAFVVQRLRAAGAIVLAKANLQEFARGGVSISSLGGQVRNPTTSRAAPAAPAAAPARPLPPTWACWARAATPASRSARRPRPAAWSACGPRAAW
jgi:amidase